MSSYRDGGGDPPPRSVHPRFEPPPGATLAAAPASSTAQPQRNSYSAPPTSASRGVDHGMPRSGYAFVTYEDETVWRLQPVNYEKTITLHKTNPANEHFLSPTSPSKLHVHDEVEYDRSSSGGSTGGGGAFAGENGLSITPLPPGTIADRGYDLFTGSVARMAGDKFGFISFPLTPALRRIVSRKPASSTLTTMDIFFQLGGCVDAFTTFDRLRPGVEVQALVVDSMNQPDKKVAVYVRTTGRTVDPLTSSSTSAPPSRTPIDRNRDRDRDRDRGDFYGRSPAVPDPRHDRLGGGGGEGGTPDRFGSERFGSEAASDPHGGNDNGDLVGWIVWVDRDEGSFRPTNSEEEYKFELRDAYAQIRVGDEVSCRKETQRTSSDPLVVYNVERLSDRDPPLDKVKSWRYGQILSMNEREGWVEDVETRERVEMQRNQLSTRRWKDRDPIMYLRMSYKNPRTNAIKSVAALVEEDRTGGGGAAAKLSTRVGPPGALVPAAAPLASSSATLLPSPSVGPGTGAGSSVTYQEGWITSLQDSFGIVRLQGDQFTHFFHLKHVVSRFDDLHRFDCIRCTLKPDGTAVQVEKLPQKLPLALPDWRRGQIVDMGAHGGYVVDVDNPQDKFEFKVYALRSRGRTKNHDYVLFILCDSPKFGKNFVGIIELDPNPPQHQAQVDNKETVPLSVPPQPLGVAGNRGAPQDRFMTTANGASTANSNNKNNSIIQVPAVGKQQHEGWITSLQDSFGILRIIGDRTTRFFHRKNCLTNLQELRNGDSVRCNLKMDGASAGDACNVEKLPYQLPLNPPDWRPGRVVKVGVLSDTETGQEHEFRTSVVKGLCAPVGTNIVYLICDSPKYGKNFVATVAPDRGPEGNKAGLNPHHQSHGGIRNVPSGEMIPPQHQQQQQLQQKNVVPGAGGATTVAAPGGNDLVGWIVEVDGEEGSFRASAFDGEWGFQLKDAEPDIQVGDEVSCRKKRGNVYGVKRLTTRDPPLPRECWSYGKVASITDVRGYVVDDWSGQRIEMLHNQLSPRWREGDQVMFLRMSYPDRTVATLVREVDGGAGVNNGGVGEVGAAASATQKPTNGSVTGGPRGDPASAEEEERFCDGWITSTQSSFGFVRLVGDQRSYYFHLEQCRTPFRDMRIGDPVRCSIKPQGHPKEVGKMAIPLPLKAPDWKKATVSHLDDKGGKLIDFGSGKEMEFVKHALKGRIAEGDAVVYLLIDSPKYGKDFVTLVKPLPDDYDDDAQDDGINQPDNSTTTAAKRERSPSPEDRPSKIHRHDEDITPGAVHDEDDEDDFGDDVGDDDASA